MAELEQVRQQAMVEAEAVAAPPSIGPITTEEQLGATVPTPTL